MDSKQTNGCCGMSFPTNSDSTQPFIQQEYVLHVRNKMVENNRCLPNLLVTGTPGCGKTLLSKKLTRVLNEQTNSSFMHLPISDMIRDNKWYDSFDHEIDSYVFDEDSVVKGIEHRIEGGGCVVDFHCVDIFPVDWMDIVVVLRTDTCNLYDRLLDRNYNKLKIDENMECEIMNVLSEEARTLHPNCLELNSNTTEQLENNLGFISSLVLETTRGSKNAQSFI